MFGSGSGFKPWTASERGPLVTPSSWRPSPCPHSPRGSSAPPSATRPSGSSGATARPSPPPRTPSSTTCRWETGAAGQWDTSQQTNHSDLIKLKLIPFLCVVADSSPCTKGHATLTKSRGLMSLPLTRSASRPLMKRARGPSPVFTHSPPRAPLQPPSKVPEHFLLSDVFRNSHVAFLCGPNLSHLMVTHSHQRGLE